MKDPSPRLRPLARAVSVPLLALAADRWIGEPSVLHPVVGMGRLLDTVSTGREHVSGPPAVVAGGAALAAAMALVMAAARGHDRVRSRLPGPVAVALESVALSTLLSDALLRREGVAVERALGRDLADGREAVARLVSRDTTTLDAGEVLAAAIESLAENTSDSVVAPLLAWAVGGLPGAAAYRLVNTADAMWGYRDDRWEWWGKPAARLDDLLNLLPARLTARLLAPVTSWRRIRREARRTPSPNAGWPMAAVACRFDLRLAKPGVYVLNASGQPPRSGDLAEVSRAVARAATIASVLAAGLAAVVAVTRTRDEGPS